jgi:hypothetical protein
MMSAADNRLVPQERQSKLRTERARLAVPLEHENLVASAAEVIGCDHLAGRPQGLKPSGMVASCGTTEVVPFP